MTTASTIDDTEFQLIDLWPGYPDPRLGTPKDGFTGSDHHDVTAAAYPVGTKIQVYDTSNSGYATFIYLQLVDEDGTNVLLAKNIVAWDASALSYGVTNEAAGDLLADMGPAAISISDVTKARYGWFWCGGVCPVTFVSDLDGDYATDGDVTAGCSLLRVDSSAPNTTYGEFAFGIVTAVAEPCIGMTRVID